MKNNAGQLTGLVALVLGGTAGIGLACAKAFAAEGAAGIYLVGRNPERAESAVAELKADFEHCEFAFASADVSTEQGANSAVAGCISRFGRIDILLISAGGDPMPRLFQHMEASQIEATIQGTLLSAVLPSRAAIGHMIEQGSGVILTFASDAGKLATPGETVVGAAMAGMMMFSRALANEVKRSGIRVNCISPSIVRDTPLYDKLMADEFCNKLFSKAERMAQLGVVEPPDLAALAVYLASPAAAKLSGQVVSLNGGISMA